MLATTPSRIIASLIDEGPTHRADLARRLSVSRTAVSNAVDQLLHRRLLTSVPRTTGGPTLKDQVCLTPQFGLIAGVVVDFDETLVGVGTLDGRLLASRTTPGDPQAPGAERMRAVPEVLAGLTHDVDETAPLLFTQLAINTQADRTTGDVTGGAASSAWADVNPKRLLEDAIGTPVRLENTARLLALAEQLERPDVSDLVYVQISYGVAMGVIIQGRILGGARGGAGELGHTSIDLEGRPCTCRGRGCLMQYIGRHALVEEIEELLGPGSDVPDLIHAAHGGSREATAMLATFGHRTGCALTSVCNLLQPSTLVIGGCFTEAGEQFLAPLREALRERALPLAVGTLSIENATGSLIPRTVMNAALRCLRTDEEVRSAAIYRSLPVVHTRRRHIVS